MEPSCNGPLFERIACNTNSYVTVTWCLFPMWFNSSDGLLMVHQSPANDMWSRLKTLPLMVRCGFDPHGLESRQPLPAGKWDDFFSSKAFIDKNLKNWSVRIFRAHSSIVAYLCQNANEHITISIRERAPSVSPIALTKKIPSQGKRRHASNQNPAVPFLLSYRRVRHIGIAFPRNAVVKRCSVRAYANFCFPRAVGQN